jgi:hypothetical protein
MVGRSRGADRPSPHSRQGRELPRASAVRAAFPHTAPTSGIGGKSVP